MVYLLVSACLLGVNCKYDGGNNRCEAVCDLLNQENICLVPVCPEQLGGLQTPRDPSECLNGQVVSSRGADVTEAFYRGAQEALKIAQAFDCKCAILKERSPSCGSAYIYDGTFSHTLRHGDGVTAQVLREAGIKIYGESEIPHCFHI